MIFGNKIIRIERFFILSYTHLTTFKSSPHQSGHPFAIGTLTINNLTIRICGMGLTYKVILLYIIIYNNINIIYR